MIKGNFFFWKSWKFSREREREKGGSAARTVLFSNCPPSIVVALLYYSRTRKDEYKERERSLDDLHACSGGEGGGVAALTDGSCATTPPEISSSDCSPKKFLRLPSILLIARERERERERVCVCVCERERERERGLDCELISFIHAGYIGGKFSTGGK